MKKKLIKSKKYANYSKVIIYSTEAGTDCTNNQSCGGGGNNCTNSKTC